MAEAVGFFVDASAFDVVLHTGHTARPAVREHERALFGAHHGGCGNCEAE